MRDQLIEAAKRVAEEATDSNIARLLQILLDFPFDEMPAEFLNSPIYPGGCEAQSLASKLCDMQIVQPRA